MVKRYTCFQIALSIKVCASEGLAQEESVEIVLRGKIHCQIEEKGEGECERRVRREESKIQDPQLKSSNIGSAAEGGD